MINPTGKKLEKLLFGIFDSAIEGADRYNHNGSLWLIFTDEMRWVVEYTKSQTLWYNYYFFTNEMEMVGLDCVEDKDLIQKWFESRFLNIDPVEYTRGESFHFNRKVEDTIKNGVKETKLAKFFSVDVEDTIQNGVKHAYVVEGQRQLPVKDTIQNGVKETFDQWNENRPSVKDVVQNGVKHCEDGDRLDGDERFEDIIQNGVREK